MSKYNNADLRVGDVVIIKEKDVDWDFWYEKGMNSFVGRSGVIVRETGHGNFTLRVDDVTYTYPRNVLHLYARDGLLMNTHAINARQCVHAGAFQYVEPDELEDVDPDDRWLYATTTKEFIPLLKPSNPKRACGANKTPFTEIPLNVLGEVAAAFHEGALKYGRHNYRVYGVKSSIYIDAAFRHLSQYWEGEDIDPDSGISHLTKAISSLIVLRDGMMQGKHTDDRPPKSDPKWIRDINDRVKEMNGNCLNPKDAHTDK